MDGQEQGRSTEATFSSGRLDSEDIEVLREDLVEMVHEDESSVHVDFAHGPSRTFDLVVGADGLHSTVRSLAFGPEERFAHHLGSYLSVFSAENFLGQRVVDRLASMRWEGTSLALVGAHVLADCLARDEGDHRAAYARYERRMRPFVTLNQALATENPGGPASEESVAHAKNALSLDS
ncbi:hypothetical protein AB0D29_08845 [Streptomyces sp. NPDC048424]|uniref:hypothetical protein n=1 Tax=Streptomyces sp. NPDC048424 TaxID=3155265 RepID=UPI00342AD569